MSDGPHRTLEMRKGWRKVAGCAFNGASSTEEVCELLPPAIADDWRREVPSELIAALKKEFGDGLQGRLGIDENPGRFSALRKMAAGFPLAGALVNCAETVAADGLYGPAGILEAGRRTIEDRVQRQLRSMEEHHIRATDGKSTVDVPGRLGETANACGYGKLAAQLLRSDPTPIERRLPKHAGLDDGPRR